MRILHLTWILLISGHLFAQEGFTTGGGDASGTDGTASFSIGQPAYLTQYGSTGYATQGVQQTFEVYMIGQPKPTESTVSLKVYPVPTGDHLYIRGEGEGLQGLELQLSDATGTTVFREAFSPPFQQLNFQNWASGTYLLTVTRNGQTVSTFKIVHQ